MELIFDSTSFVHVISYNLIPISKYERGNFKERSNFLPGDLEVNVDTFCFIQRGMAGVGVDLQVGYKSMNDPCLLLFFLWREGYLIGRSQFSFCLEGRAYDYLSQE